MVGAKMKTEKTAFKNGKNIIIDDNPGHSHFSGDDGSLTTDLSTITTALSIAKQISVRILQH